MQLQDDLSFMPDDYLSQKSIRRTNHLCSALLLAVLVALGGAFLWSRSGLLSLRAEHAQVTDEFNIESDRIKRLDELRKQHESILRRAQLADSLIEKLPRSVMLAALRSHLPDGAALVEFALNSAEIVAPKPPSTGSASAAKKSKKPDPKAPPPPPEPKRYRQFIKLTGIAYTDLQVAQFIGNLVRSDYFEEVSLIQSRPFKVGLDNVRRFEVEMRLRPDAAIARPTGPVVAPTWATESDKPTD
jgi:Tfp pilus assembly protein PilN